MPLIVNRFAETGFINDIIYETQDTQKSKVVLLADRFGSMVAHKFLEHHFGGTTTIPVLRLSALFFLQLAKEITEGIHYELGPTGKVRRFLYIKAPSDRNTAF